MERLRSPPKSGRNVRTRSLRPARSCMYPPPSPHPASAPPRTHHHGYQRSAADKGEATEPKGNRNHFVAISLLYLPSAVRRQYCSLSRRHFLTSLWVNKKRMFEHHPSVFTMLSVTGIYLGAYSFSAALGVQTVISRLELVFSTLKLMVSSTNIVTSLCAAV